MKKLLVAFCLLLSAFLYSNAQDFITTKDGTDIMAKIIEVSSTEVKYKKYNNPDGPTFVLKKSDILIILYEDGEKEVIKSSASSGYGSSPNTTREVYEGMKYKQYKSYYTPKLYVPQAGDPYSRFWAGAASFLIPGLGQGVDGEWGRGALICLGNIGLYAVMLSDSYYDLNGTLYYGTVGSIANIARIVYDIWSIVDAVRVAKIKNMYYQDIRAQRASIDFNIEPYFAYTPSGIGNSLTPTTGLTLKLNF